MKVSSSSFFVTLTYDDTSVPLTPRGTPTLSQDDWTLFMKSFRHCYPGHKIRFYMASEYGTKTMRPHYHVIFFNIPVSGDTLYIDLLSTWKKGLVHIGSVTEKSIAYVTKYVITRGSWPSFDPLAEEPFSRMSRRPGLGAGYIQSSSRFHGTVKHCYYVKPGGVQTSLPRYYKERLYNPYARHRIAESCANDGRSKLERDRHEFARNNPDVNYFAYGVDQVKQFISEKTKQVTKSEKL